MTTKPKGVMIKGMDMPKSCFSCVCRNELFASCQKSFESCRPVGCRIMNKRGNKTNRPSWCPLQEIN